jgi:tRNA threonylcarbamoyladenosine biosynthesis protein TsaB
MLLLVVDTAGPSGGVLLAEENENESGEAGSLESTKILGVIELNPRQFSAELIPAISELLDKNHRRLADLDAFAVVSGPGSFTGLRVGLSAVKALAEVTKKPVLMLSRLAIMASMAAKVPSIGAGEAVHMVLDAGRGEFYHGVYRDAGKTRVEESFDSLDALAQKISQQPGSVIVSEKSVKMGIHSFAGSRLCEVPSPAVQDGLSLALEEWRARRFHDPVDVDANYLRRSDAVVVIRAKGEPIAQATGAEHMT